MSQESQSNEEEVEISPLDYARANALSRNYLKEDLGFADFLPLQCKLNDNLVDASKLEQFDLGSPPKLEERLMVSKDAAFLLQSVIREDSQAEIDTITSSLFSTKHPPRKLELPLLRSDHETDCRFFASREGIDIKLQDVRLPLEMVDDERNEGFVYPQRFWDIGPDTLQKLKSEKLGASKQTLVYLTQCMRPTWTEDDATELWDSEVKYKRNTALEPVTPPISPAFKPLPLPYEPSSDDSAYNLPLLSSPIDPTKQYLEDIEKEIFEQDIPTPIRNARAKKASDDSSDTLSSDPAIKLGDIYTPLASMENTPPSLELKRVKREYLKVEEPLTPINSATMPKSVRFSDVVEEMQLDSDSRVCSPDFESTFFKDAFGDAFGDALREANQRAEQEKLIAADATARVDVPIMDFSKADPPWKRFESIQNSAELVSMQMSLIRDVVCTRLPKLLHIRKDIKLQWMPFPKSLGKVAEETFPDQQHEVDAFLQGVIDGDIIDSSDLTWKPEGLKILKDEDDDDEIDFGKFNRKDTPLDLTSLVKKRKLEMQEAEQAKEDLASKKVGSAQLSLPAKPGDKQEQHKTTGFSLLLGGAFSAGGLLDNFLELRGAKKAKLTNGNYFNTKPNTPKEAPQAIRTATPQAMLLQIRKSPLAKAPLLPVPNLTATPLATSIVVSSTLLKNRGLVKNLEHVLPALRMVERDFTAHNSTTWQAGTVTRSPIKSPLDSEADMIISPSTGIILASLQKIKQKPLPGQTKKTAIRERIEKVSGRYEKLVVLISEGRPDEIAIGLDESDCLAYNEFAGFVSGFENSITAVFIAGGEETLAKWIASTILQHFVQGDSELLTEETHWELFLRRAGLNAFAAQAVLAQLKAPDGVDAASPTKAGHFGLTAFVEMGGEERMARFGLLCGMRLMARVSAVIDGAWQ